ncbi:hypothetical protein [Pectinatus cerevisiiphilus]|uniref:Uncharacterized protein n=1 Tax=Pectinatus cerevisiiphilus TaxID=86956 RepID=A0A4R3KAM0_9FIRM|nr:hypothetical protein [Pectinatus cerevisiiphilus]TCS80038.1 hypothetical protein EDC37_105108 [Pectinatus cerevisiiphilus]
MMSDSMREMLDLKELAQIVNGVHNPNADAYRARLRKRMDAIPEYAYLNSLRMEDFKTLDDLYATVKGIKTEEDLEKRIIRTPEVQKSAFRRLWKQLPKTA